MNSRTVIAYLAAIVTILIWGETFVSTKIVLNHGLRPADLLALDFCHLHPTFCPPSKNQEQIILLFVQVTQFCDTGLTDALRKALLCYCELDTLAMVFIWEYFYHVCNGK